MKIFDLSTTNQHQDLSVKIHKGFKIVNWVRGCGIYKGDRLIDSANTEEDAIAIIDEQMAIIEQAVAASNNSIEFVDKALDKIYLRHKRFVPSRRRTADILPFPGKPDGE